MNLVPDLYRKGCYQHSAFKILERGMWFFQEWIPGSTVVVELGESKPKYYNEHELTITNEAVLEIVNPLFESIQGCDIQLCGVVSERKFWLYASKKRLGDYEYYWHHLSITERLATRTWDTKFCMPKKWEMSSLPDSIQYMRQAYPHTGIFGVIAQPACSPLYAAHFGRLWGKVIL